MALEKNYAILEIQNALLNVEVDAAKYPNDADLYLEVAKETYDQLEQIFRLVFEPTFNPEFNKEPAYDEKEYIYNLENNAAKDRENSLMLEAELAGLRKEHLRLNEELNNILKANEALHVNFNEHLESKNSEINWLRNLVGSALMNKAVSNG